MSASGVALACPKVLAPVRPHPEHLYRPLWLSPFGVIHVASLGALVTGVTRNAVICCVALYLLRMFGVAAGYHRYFAHRTFKTSRAGQFVLAWIAQTTCQKGVLWWAAHHRTHHKHSDEPGDVHSPVVDGFWYAHFGWLSNNADGTDYSKIRDLTKFPELIFLNRHWYIPPLTMAIAVAYFLGLPGLFFGFCLSTVFVWHGTFCVNSLAHVCGSRRFDTPDSSRNNVWLAIATLGEGWHNNHHHCMGSVRQGVAWWEIDVTFYAIKALSYVGLVWDLKQPDMRRAPIGATPATAASRS